MTATAPLTVPTNTSKPLVFTRTFDAPGMLRLLA